MKKSTPFIVLIFIFACNDSPKEEVPAKPENGMEAASQFIRAALDGNYARARTFLINDFTNKQTMDTYENYYNKNLAPDDKKAYKEASIRFGKETHQVNDSVTIVHY